MDSEQTVVTLQTISEVKRTMDVANLKAVLNILKNIQEVGPLYKSWGICTTTDGYTTISNLKDLLRKYYKTWPHWTASPVYPVPHPDYECPKEAYDKTPDKWEGKYGTLRRDLLAHLIIEIEKELG